MHASLEAAKRITIFGGGLVGVELTAEIAERWPNTPLTFRQREPFLLPGFPEKAQAYARAFFERHPNVHLIFENTIPPFKYVPEGPPGEEVVFNCTGLKPAPLPNAAAAESKEQQEANMAAADKSPRSPRRNSSSKKKKNSRRSSSPASRRSNGVSNGASAVASPSPLLSLPVHSRTSLIRITPTLHVVGHSDIFALGDVMVEDALLDEPQRRLPKVAYQAELQAWCVAENLMRQAEGRREWNFPADLVGAPSAPSLVCCSLGKSDGLVIFNSLVVSGWISVITKFMLERTKMMQLRGNIIGECAWTVSTTRGITAAARDGRGLRFRLHAHCLFVLPIACLRSCAGAGADVAAAASPHALVHGRPKQRARRNQTVIAPAPLRSIFPDSSLRRPTDDKGSHSHCCLITR